MRDERQFGLRMGSFETEAGAGDDELDYLRPEPGSGRLLLRLVRASQEQTPKCQGKSDEYVDIEDLPTEEQAEEMCSGCPLLEMCREYSEIAQPYGVWGGKVYDERDE